ncbi:MAG: NifU family protein [Lactobacillaceae bacterium]|jgi:Fe-S cluster biogenesis protein NfuA|nr:NifU family protein [Lactobacillaceae bacterium]
MIIETQLAPNEDVMNFFLPVKITEGVTLEIIDAKTLRKSPLGEQIFDVGGIKSILITPDVVSVTKNSDAYWDELKPQILAEIVDFLNVGSSAIIEQTTKSKDDIISQIQGLISARIQPAIQQDGGDIEFKNFDNGIVYVELKGNCVGCAYALVTLKDGVEKLLKTYIPEVKEVRNIDKENN